MSDENQQRRNTRFPVRQSLLAVSKGRELSGICRDINAEGVFFFTSTPLTEGDQVEIRLNLPAGTIFSDEVSLLASGKALRIECNDGDGRCGVAVAFEHIEIHHSSSTSAGSD
jgi:hypothetical protein